MIYAEKISKETVFKACIAMFILGFTTAIVIQEESSENTRVKTYHKIEATFEVRQDIYGIRDTTWVYDFLEENDPDIEVINMKWKNL